MLTRTLLSLSLSQARAHASDDGDNNEFGTFPPFRSGRAAAPASGRPPAQHQTGKQEQRKSFVSEAKRLVFCTSLHPTSRSSNAPCCPDNDSPAPLDAYSSTATLTAPLLLLAASAA